MSQQFVIPKSDGRLQAVFNLKNLNNFLQTEHFKMESLNHVSDLLYHGWVMCKLDLKDAFHSIRIHPAGRRWLRFQWQGVMWQYRCLPFGLSDVPRTFTKILAPVAGFLRSLGIHLVVYLDDWLFLAATAEAATKSVDLAIFLLEHLGFIISAGKSILKPVQSLEFLGIAVDSASMLFRLPDRKFTGISKDCCGHMLNKGTICLSAMWHLLGKMQDAVKAVPLVQAKSRMLQLLQKTLRDEHQNLALSSTAQADLSWWIHLTPSQRCKPIQISPPSLTLTTDASNYGWGATCNGRRTLDHRGRPSHQLEEAESRPPGTEDVLLGQVESDNPTRDRQCLSRGVRESARWNTLISSMYTSERNLGLGSGPSPVSDCSPRSWCQQRTSGLRVSSSDG